MIGLLLLSSKASLTWIVACSLASQALYGTCQPGAGLRAWLILDIYHPNQHHNSVTFAGMLSTRSLPLSRWLPADGLQVACALSSHFPSLLSLDEAWIAWQTAFEGTRLHLSLEGA